MRFQALVFDLDDTLMDTHGQLVGEAHWQACLAMQNAGLNVPVQVLFDTRMRITKEQPRIDIDLALAHYYDCQDTQVIAAGHQTYFNPEISQLEPFPGVPKMLEELKQSHRLFLVTSGYEKTQARKLEVLGLSAYFDEVYYAPVGHSRGKEDALRHLQQKYALNYSGMVVIGDRINNEIVIGKRLGCPTIWIRHGECAHILPEGPHEEPDLMTHSVIDVPLLLQQL